MKWSQKFEAVELLGKNVGNLKQTTLSLQSAENSKAH